MMMKMMNMITVEQMSRSMLSKLSQSNIHRLMSFICQLYLTWAFQYILNLGGGYCPIHKFSIFSLNQNKFCTKVQLHINYLCANFQMI